MSDFLRLLWVHCKDHITEKTGSVADVGQSLAHSRERPVKHQTDIALLWTDRNCDCCADSPFVVECDRVRPDAACCAQGWGGRELR